MPPNPKAHRRLSRRLSRQRWRRRWRWVAAIAAIVVGVWLLGLAIALRQAMDRPVGAVLVLGGSIQREIFVAQQAREYPDRPILISSGSPPPCIRGAFEREGAPLDRVWLETCAQSTFENFFYSLPLLEQWGVRRVQLATSQTHLPRALWLARVVLGSHGIWTELLLVPETGVPGNREYWWKTGLDVLRGAAWAIASYAIRPECDRLVALEAVDLDEWCQRGFACEYQGNLGDLCDEAR